MCFEPCGKPVEICCLFRLQRRPETILKTDFVADIKNMFQGTYKDTRLTLTETEFSSKNVAQFLHNKTVVKSNLLVVKTWNFMMKDSIRYLTLLVRYVKACTDINRNVDCFIANFENAFVCWDKFGSHSHRRNSPLQEVLF